MSLAFDPIAILEIVSLVFALICMIKLLVAEITDLGNYSTNTIECAKRNQNFYSSDSIFNVGKTISSWHRLAHF